MLRVNAQKVRRMYVMSMVENNIQIKIKIVISMYQTVPLKYNRVIIKLCTNKHLIMHVNIKSVSILNKLSNTCNSYLIFFILKFIFNKNLSKFLLVLMHKKHGLSYFSLFFLKGLSYTIQKHDIPWFIETNKCQAALWSSHSNQVICYKCSIKQTFG